MCCSCGQTVHRNGWIHSRSSVGVTRIENAAPPPHCSLVSPARCRRNEPHAVKILARVTAKQSSPPTFPLQDPACIHLRHTSALMAFHLTETSCGRASILQVPSKPETRNGSQKLSGPSAFSAASPRTPGADSWRLGTTAADQFDSSTRQGTPMRGRKTAAGPPGWMISAAAPSGFDASGSHMRAHIQSLANLDKEVLAEKLFHSKVQLSELLTENVRHSLTEASHLARLHGRQLHDVAQSWSQLEHGFLSSVTQRAV